MAETKYYNLLQTSKVIFKDYIFESGGNFFTLYDGKLYQLILAKIKPVDLESADRLQGSKGLQIELLKTPSGDIYNSIKNNGSAKTEMSYLYTLTGSILAEKGEGMNLSSGATMSEKAYISAIEKSQKESQEYKFVLICVANLNDIIIPSQYISEIEAEEEEKDFMAWKYITKTLDLSIQDITLGLRPEPPKIEEKSINLPTNELEDIADQEDEKVVFFDESKYYLIKNGSVESVVEAEGENNVNNTLFGKILSNDTDGNVQYLPIDFDRSDIIKELTKEEAFKLSRPENTDPEKQDKKENEDEIETE